MSNTFPDDKGKVIVFCDSISIFDLSKKLIEDGRQNHWYSHLQLTNHKVINQEHR